MAIPDYQSVMLPILKLGASAEVSIKDAIEEISNEFDLTQEERDRLLPSGIKTKIRSRVEWAVTYLVHAQLLCRPRRGYFAITERGSEVLANPPAEIDIKFLKQYPEFLEFVYKKTPPDKPFVSVEKEGSASLDQHIDAATPEERIDDAYTEINTALQDELLSRVLEAPPAFFEKLIVQLLVSMGYGGSSGEAGKHIGRSGDGGVDGVIDEDKLGLDVIYIQAKRYAPGNTVGRPEIQQFAGSLIGMGANKGVFVTTSKFSGHAQEYARSVPQRIILIDGEKLTSLMLEHNVGVRVNREIELKKIDEDFFME